ncbi:distal tail protein Dit [Virgibacillus sp. Bac330]|uniref:distal tail protein Dit n=1 Tax=Virgibacillus sp. Bac330 TaxID=2419841 RepID=UPI001F09DF5C|nr:distal tail protein Dit [Virgibacillus sp. Bac330]
MSYQEYMGNLFRMRFNGNDLPDYFYVLEVTGRSLSPNEIRSKIVPGRNGSYRQGKRKPGVPLKVKAMLRLNSSDELRIAIDELNGILDTDEEAPIVFSDEPNKTYYGEMEDVSEGIEVEGTHIVTITFFRSAPYKYGQTYKTIALKKYTWEEYAGQTWGDLIGT